MQKMKSALAALCMTALLMGSSAASAKPKVVERYKTTVDDKNFKVIRYDNNSLKVVQTDIISNGVSYNLRERMRIAARQATGCDIADDFWLNGWLIGQIDCRDQKEHSL